MRNRTKTRSPRRLSIALLLAALSVACQGMDRLEPDSVVEVGSAEEGSERGTRLDPTSGPEFGSGGRLTEDIAARWIRQIEGAGGAEGRLELAAQFLREYPGADVISYLHELVGDAQSELGNPKLAADAWERAVEMSWPAPDILGLPLTNVELPYQIGWARFEAGEPLPATEWLTRATLISDRPQLDQGLRFLHAELGEPGGSFEDWFESERAGIAVEAPDFELPGYQIDSIKLSERTSRLTLLNFWTPT